MRRAGGRVVVDLQPELSPQNRTESLDVGLETGVHACSDPQSHPARRSNAGCAEEQGQLDDWYRRAADQSDSLDERWGERNRFHGQRPHRLDDMAERKRNATRTVAADEPPSSSSRPVGRWARCRRCPLIHHPPLSVTGEPAARPIAFGASQKREMRPTARDSSSSVLGDDDGGAGLVSRRDSGSCLNGAQVKPVVRTCRAVRCAGVSASSVRNMDIRAVALRARRSPASTVAPSFLMRAQPTPAGIRLASASRPLR
jgi:hypothetical protein